MYEKTWWGCVVSCSAPVRGRTQVCRQCIHRAIVSNPTRRTMMVTLALEVFGNRVLQSRPGLQGAVHVSLRFGISFQPTDERGSLRNPSILNPQPQTSNSRPYTNLNPKT